MNTDKLLGMLLEAIDYSFLQSNGDYDKSLTYPVIDKVKYIKEKLKNIEVKEVDLEEEFESFLDNIEGVPRMWHSDEQIEWAKDIAKHFFELGLNIQKGE